MKIDQYSKQDFETVKKKIDAYRENAKTHAYVIPLVLNVIKTFDGQKITKRIATAISKVPELAEFNVYYTPQYGMFHIDIVKKTETFNSYNSLHCLIGYESNPIVNYAKVEEHNPCYTLDAGRLEKYNAVTDDMIRAWVARLNETIDNLVNLEKNMGEYGLEYCMSKD
jgi:hypothetical protein